MDGIIRKIKLSYPFKVGENQKIDVFSIDDLSDKWEGHKMHSIKEEVDQVDGKYVYKIFLHKNEQLKLWKSVTPEGCTKEVEYAL